jgi:hypothetical protein
MILNYLSAMWGTIAPVVGNHLWQSTVFLAMAGLLTLALRKNQARTRYWLWLAASAKFLLPFSLLVSAGSYFAWEHSSAGTKDGLFLTMEGVGTFYKLCDAHRCSERAFHNFPESNACASGDSYNALVLRVPDRYFYLVCALETDFCNGAERCSSDGKPGSRSSKAPRTFGR